MRRLALFVGLSLVTLSLAHPPEALAAPKKEQKEEKALPQIVETGIAEFDSVFMKAKAIHDTLDGEDKKLKEAREQISIALGVATDAPLKTALADLNTKAGGKLKVALEGGTPKLQASEAVPENVQKAMDAVNKLIDVSAGAASKGKELYPQAQELAKAAADFPGKLPNLVSDPMELAKKTKVVTTDVKVTAATPERVDRLVKSVDGTFADVKGAFGG
jgi:hypothetical protein